MNTFISHRRKNWYSAYKCHSGNGERKGIGVYLAETDVYFHHMALFMPSATTVHRQLLFMDY